MNVEEQFKIAEIKIIKKKTPKINENELEREKKP